MKASTTPLTFSVSVRRLDLANLGAALRALESAGLAELKIDIADGTFVPEFMAGFELIEAVRSVSVLPLHAHLLTERPERFLDVLHRLGCAAVTVPIETSVHAHRTLARIRDLGLAAGVSLLPGSALTKLEYVIGMVDHVVLPVHDLDANAETPAPAAAFDRVRILRENLDYHESKAVVHVEGQVSIVDAAKLAALGATRIVIDRSDVLRAESLAAATREYIDAVARARRIA